MTGTGTARSATVGTFFFNTNQFFNCKQPRRVIVAARVAYVQTQNVRVVRRR
jgi:hypothetical protein